MWRFPGKSHSYSEHVQPTSLHFTDFGIYILNRIVLIEHSELAHVLDRYPYQYIPADFEERSKLWRASAKNLVTGNDPFTYMQIENLMFAELPILQMEKALARQDGNSPDSREPLLIMECSALSILWLCGLYEATRNLKAAKSPKFPPLEGLHKKLEIARMPFAKHQVFREHNKPHFPTSTWSPETGRVGWQVWNPRSNKFEPYVRTDLADEFLKIAAADA